MFNMEDEIDNLPQAEKKESVELSSDQQAKLSEAMSILNSLAKECGCDVNELISKEESPTEEVEAPEMEESEEEQVSDAEEVEAPEAEEKDGKKLALYIAQLKAKRG